MRPSDDAESVDSRRWRSLCQAASCSYDAAQQHLSAAAAHVAGAIGDRRRELAACLNTRRPPFATASSSLMPAPSGGGGEGPGSKDKPRKKGSKKEGGSKKGKKAKALAPNSPEGMKAALSQLTPEELEAVRGAAWRTVLKNTPAKIEGKETDMLKVAKQEAEAKRIRDVGGDKPTLRTTPRWLANRQIPGHELRPGETKMQLRPAEQEALGLDLLGVGHMFRPAPFVGMLFGGQRDFTFGVYARQKDVQAELMEKWSGQDPKEVLANQQFYDEVMQAAPLIELTFMAMPVRRVPLLEVASGLRSRLRDTLKFAGGGKLPSADATAIDQLAGVFSEEKLKQSGLTAKGELLKDSHFIFTTGRKGQLSLEAITPGTLRDRRAVFIGTWQNPRLAPALASQVLGPDPIDQRAKLAVGQAVLFVANGFEFGIDADERVHNQYVMDEDGKPLLPAPHVVEVPATPRLFSMPSDGRRKRRRTLLNNISRSSQQPPDQQLQGSS